jgi:cob(I)alamin adenosyltransferase
MKIYTKTGDSGTTSLVGGKRTSKNSLRIEAYGTIDELNSFIGLLAAHLHTDTEKAALLDIQRILFDIGGYLATEAGDVEKYKIRLLSDEQIAKIENQIDLMNKNLAPLQQFILPAGSVEATLAQVCRTVCRRAERRIVDLQQEMAIYPNLLRFINRLSDFFFVLARCQNQQETISELVINDK